MPDIPAFENSPYTVAPPQTSFDPSYNPFSTAAVPPSAYSSASATNKETERESFGQDVREWSAPAGTSVRSSMNKAECRILAEAEIILLRLAATKSGRVGALV